MRKGFSPSQRPALNDYLALAWAAHCRHEGLAESIGARCLKKRCQEKGCAFCTWYEDTLEGATGHRSSTECNAGTDFEAFMAALEEIHCESYEWQMRKFGGPLRRILHAVHAVSPGFEMDEEYLRRIATNALRGHGAAVEWVMPELHQLAPRELLMVKHAAVAYVRGKVERGEAPKVKAAAVEEVEAGDDPF